MVPEEEEVDEGGGAEDADEGGGAEEGAPMASNRKRKATHAAETAGKPTDEATVHRSRHELSKRQLNRNVKAILKQTDALKLSGEGSDEDVWLHTVATLLSTPGKGLDNLVTLDPEGPLYHDLIEPLLRELVGRIESVYKDPKRWALWMGLHKVPDDAIDDFRQIFCDQVASRYREGGPDHALFNSGADGRLRDQKFYVPRPIPGLFNLMMPRTPSKRRVVDQRKGVSTKMDGTQSGNGLGNDTYSTGVNYLLEKTAVPIHTALTVVWLGTLMSTMVVLAYYQDAARLFKRTPERPQTTTGMRNIQASHSPSEFIMFSMSLNGEESAHVWNGMDNCREFCRRKTTATVEEGWDEKFGDPGEYSVSYVWGGDHCNLMSQAGLMHGTNDNHHRCHGCIAQQKHFMCSDLRKKWSDPSKRRTTEKQRMWAHAVEGECTACKKMVTKADVLDRTKADQLMTHEQQLKHAAAHFGVLPGRGPMLDGVSHKVDADLVSDIMHNATNITSFLIINTLFKFLPASDTAKNKALRATTIKKLKETMEKLPVNLYNFGIQKKTMETCTPSPTGPEAYTLIFCFLPLIDIVHPKENGTKKRVMACWEALLAMYIVHWDTSIGDTQEDRASYRDALRETAHTLMKAVIACCGSSSSCVYFHICLWHLPHFGYKYGSLAKFCTEAIEGNNAAVKHIKINGQKLAADGDVHHCHKRRKTCTVSVPMQIMRSKELVALLRAEIPVRVKMRRAQVLVNSGWRNALSYDGWKDHDADRKPSTVDALSIV